MPNPPPHPTTATTTSYDDDDAGSSDHCNKNGLPTHFLGNIDCQSNPIPSELPIEEDNILCEDEDNNRPPTPWARSKSKQNIDKLKDNNSDIHLLIGDYDDKTNQIKVVEITSNGNEWQGRNNQLGRRKQGYKTLYNMRRRQRMTNDNGTINYEEGELRREGRAVSGQ